MCSKDLILETLKRIGYQEIDSLDDNDISLLTHEELKPFFEVFCTLDENNVLTSEEIEAYSALTPAELAEIDISKKSGQFEENDNEHEKKKEACFLQEQLAQIENHNKALERQIDLFKKHEENLLLEQESQEKILMNAKKRFQKFELTKIPKAEEEFVSGLKSFLEVAQDLESLVMHSDGNQSKLPTSNFVKDIIQQYIEEEEKLLLCITSYMQTNFQLHENGTMSFINCEMLRNKELEKEATFLMKKLKSSMIDNVMSEMEVCKYKIMVKHLENVSVSDFNCPSSLLRHKLDNVVKLNEQLKKTEEEYKSYICDAVTKHVDALVAEMTLCAINEMINNILLHTKKISVPKNYLIRQRLRVEKLIASLTDQMDNFQSIKEIIQKVLKEMNEEQLCLEERQIQIEKELSDVAKNQDDQHPEPMIFSFLHKILASYDDFQVQDLSKLSITDVVQISNKYFESEELFRRRHEENKRAIDLIEKHTQGLESLLYADKMYSDWRDLEQSLNAELNHLVMKMTAFEGSISECNKDMDQKQMILDKRRNLQLAKHLYVYALMNRELFEKYIDEVKGRIENSSNQ